MLRAAPVHPDAGNTTLDELKVAMEAAPNQRSCIRLAAVRSLLLPVLENPANAGHAPWTASSSAAHFKADWFWDFIARIPQELSNRFCLALKSFIEDPPPPPSNCSLRK